MNKVEYLKMVNLTTVDEGRVESIESIYDTNLSPLLKKIISLADNVDFFDEERRALSYAEILCPAKKIGVDFVEKKLIPLVDAYDETYIVYLTETNEWAKYSTVDDVVFKKRTTIEEVL